MNTRPPSILLPLLLVACGSRPDAAIDRGGLEDGTRSPVEAPAPETNECEPDLSRCEFERYNVDLRVGDRFVLTNFLEGCRGDVGTDFFFEYEDGTTWNLAAFNVNAVVELVEADREGGPRGKGEFRIDLVGADGEEIDHATIRIDHDDESDVRPGDDVPPPSYTDDCAPPARPGDADPSNPGDADPSNSGGTNASDGPNGV